MRRYTWPGILFIIVSCVLCATLATTLRARSDEKPMSDRVTNLEVQVSDLQARVISLEKQIASLSQIQGRTPSESTSDLTAWRSLTKGMSKTQVRKILGEPREINVQTYSETWWYLGNGYVSFNNSGIVTSWSEPSPEMLKLMEMMN